MGITKLKWSYASSIDKDYIFELALSMGWKENKVQVRKFEGMETWWYIEPYEEDCVCPNVVPPPSD